MSCFWHYGDQLSLFALTLRAGLVAGIAMTMISPPRATAQCEGVLVASDGGSRRLAAPARPEGGAVAGDGWTFKAAPGWVVREGARRGDYEVVRQ